MPDVTVVQGEPVSGCCQATIKVERLVGPDTAVFAADKLLPAGSEQGYPAVLQVVFVKTYDNPDSGAFEVSCSACGVEIDIEVEES